MKAKLIGVVEDTENGHKRYEQIAFPPCPVLSVARSPLKEPEDFLVGHAIVFSAEALIRQSGVVMVNKRALVIGYGKIGVVGPYIYLIQSEILKSVQVLVDREFSQAIHALPVDEKAAIANFWLQNYNGGH